MRVEKESGAVFTNITANALDTLAGTETILPIATDHVYFGNKFPFSRISFDLVTPASADGGAMVVEYWNGSTWVAVSRMFDTTKVGVNTLRQDGAISWDVPTDWVANDEPAAGTNLYYVRIHTTTNTGTDAVIQLSEPFRASITKWCSSR